MNHPPATLFQEFLKERLYFKNVTPRTLVWYRSALTNYIASPGLHASSLPTKGIASNFSCSCGTVAFVR